MQVEYGYQSRDGEPDRPTNEGGVHSQPERETVRTHSLLYTWRGSDPSLKPILLTGDLDVVPVEPGTEAKWQEEPFGGRIADGFIWGRGAIDNKSAIVGTLEAVEMLLGEGFRPVRTVYLAYGHDDEVGGMGGAREIAALLKSRGVGLEMVLDEGGVIGEGILPGISAPVALVGIAEKGFVSIELSARTAGRHSSLPPPQSTIGIPWKARPVSCSTGLVLSSRSLSAPCSRTCGSSVRW
ncbi:MAG TPA: M20/M25/M40 family metallo-hydrolase [Gemmatimonadales bacterium]|nr:M20/M25/M40 family metallo-hydrolase [Gemmatimonadales bacterium]